MRALFFGAGRATLARGNAPTPRHADRRVARPRFNATSATAETAARYTSDDGGVEE